MKGARRDAVVEPVPVSYFSAEFDAEHVKPKSRTFSADNIRDAEIAIERAALEAADDGKDRVFLLVCRDGAVRKCQTWDLMEAEAGRERMETQHGEEWESRFNAFVAVIADELGRRFRDNFWSEGSTCNGRHIRLGPHRETFCIVFGS